MAIVAIEHLRMPNADRLRTILLILLAFMAYAWPLTLAVRLRWQRRPQLLTASAVTAFGWGLAPLIGRLLGAFLLTVPESMSRPLPTLNFRAIDLLNREKLSYLIFGRGPRMVREDVRVTLLDPIQLILCVAMMLAYLVIAGRIWRMRTEYREVRASIPEAEQDDAASRISLQTVMISVSALRIGAMVAYPALVVWLTRY